MKRISILVAAGMVWTLLLTPATNAQSYQRGVPGVIDAGTAITVRTDESIRPNGADGRVFPGYVNENVVDRRGNVVIARGSPVEMIVRQLSRNEVALDLESVTINGQQFGVNTEDNVAVAPDRPANLGANERTGKYVGGGAVIGAIIGAIAGGGKGAAIGAGAGAAAGAGAQVLTRGQHVSVPAGSLLTFRLEEPLRAGMVDRGYDRNGRHYHNDYGGSQTAYNYGREKPSYAFNVQIHPDHNVTWQGPQHASVYVRADDGPEKLFAAGQAGAQPAPWIRRGHRYVFILKNADGNEVARDVMDLR